VAAAHPAAHDSLDRDLARPSVAHRQPGAGGEHAFGTAGIQHELPSIRFRQLPFERGGDASAFAPAAVFGGQHELDAEALKPVEIKELRLPPRPIEKRRAYAMTPQRFAKRGERG